MIKFLLLYGLFTVATLVWFGLALKFAKPGYEDNTGFHYGKKP